jgi:hypothetical protein
MLDASTTFPILRNVLLLIVGFSGLATVSRVNQVGLMLGSNFSLIIRIAYISFGNRHQTMWTQG